MSHEKNHYHLHFIMEMKVMLLSNLSRDVIYTNQKQNGTSARSRTLGERSPET